MAVEACKVLKGTPVTAAEEGKTEEGDLGASQTASAKAIAAAFAAHQALCTAEYYETTMKPILELKRKLEADGTDLGVRCLLPWVCARVSL